MRAVVAQCRINHDGFKASLLAPKLTAAKLTSSRCRTPAAARFGRAPKLVKAAGKPGEVALMSAPDTLTGLRVDHARRRFSVWVRSTGY